MRRVYIAMASGIVALFGLAMLKNYISYGYKSVKWRIVKSLIDAGLVALAAVKMPALLISWVVLWITRPITRRGVSITLSILFGVLFSAIGGITLEVICILAIPAIDLLTGQTGIYGWWKTEPPANFMPFLATRKEGQYETG